MNPTSRSVSLVEQPKSDRGTGESLARDAVSRMERWQEQSTDPNKAGDIEDLTPAPSPKVTLLFACSSLVFSGVWGAISFAHVTLGNPVTALCTLSVAGLSLVFAGLQFGSYQRLVPKSSKSDSGLPPVVH